MLRLQLILRAFQHRNFRLFFIGQSVSLIGTWMQQIAVGWLVYRMTDSPILLGLVSFSSQIFTFLLAPLAGVLADRLDRRRIILATQCLSMVQAFWLTWLVMSDLVTVNWIIVLSIFLGIANAFDVPTRQTFLLDMIEKREDLPNAIALNSSMFNGARLIGPSLAGLVIAVWGETVCFLLNGISFFFVVWALLAMKIKTARRTPKHGILTELKEGAHYAFGSIPIASLLCLIALASLLGMPYAVLMPVFAKDVLHGNAMTLGFLVGASGLGAVTGAIYLASRPSVLGFLRKTALYSGMFGLGLLCFAFSRSFWLSFALMLAIGFSMMVLMGTCNSILQTLADDDKRGRVMSFYTMAFLGTAPFGNLLMAALAGTIGVVAAVAFGGCCCFVGSLLFSTRLKKMRSLMRPVYVQKGVLPPEPV